MEVWTTTLKSVAFRPSQRSVTTVRVSHTWWPSVPTRGRCPPPRLRTPNAPPPPLSPRKRGAGRARRPLRRKHLNGGVTPSAGGKAGTESDQKVPHPDEARTRNHLPHMAGSPRRPSLPPFPCSYGISRWGSCMYMRVLTEQSQQTLRQACVCVCANERECV